MHSGQGELLNVDNNICAQTWHSMSGLEHNHGLELSSPVVTDKFKLLWKWHCFEGPKERIEF